MISQRKVTEWHFLRSMCGYRQLYYRHSPSQRFQTVRCRTILGRVILGIVLFDTKENL